MHYPDEVRSTLEEDFGQIDIYLFDQLLRGNLTSDMRILDAGCGYGRNLVYMLRSGFDVFGVDADVDGIEHVRQLSSSFGRQLSANHFRVGALEDLDFADGFADAVICNSVLHFARDRQHFQAMLAELWRVLRPGGLFFCRLGSRIGMDFAQVRPDIYRIGDGSEWFLVDEAMLLGLTERMNAVLVDPLKTTVVQDHRCMTTWVLRRRYDRPRDYQPLQ